MGKTRFQEPAMGQGKPAKGAVTGPGLKVVGILTLMVAVLLIAPNLFWLSRSSARISSRAETPLEQTRVRVSERIVELGTVRPGNSRFLFLPKAGDATFSLDFQAGGRSHEVCQEYVQASMYHVEVKIKGDIEVECSVALPLFSEFLVMKVF